MQRPIPIWFGGRDAARLRRAGRLADGWFPLVAPGRKLDEAKALVDAAASQAGRDPAAIGMEGRASWGPSGLEAVVEQAGLWSSAGATHLSINTMQAGFRSVDEHLAALAKTAERLGITAHRSMRTEALR